MSGPLRLLFIDDQETDLIFIEDLLTDTLLDVSFTARTSAADALQYLASTEILPHLIVLDLHLTGLSGLEFLAAVRYSKRTQCIPVVVRSGSADPQHHADALAAGAQTSLVKPFSYADQLAQMLDLYETWEHLRYDAKGHA
ncbi:response regulator [Deinococcus sedimenti]|uniref:Response regulatory domain-containing protein n=1 Tax=Deinococcus sedimenti TaxID=1867090 RepID=A0ABQ2SAK3_9DEIO|nr:response regulator [Deinococcus sedimenti]GGS11287.1 hypothetical protein GCM10008960_41580 [Deinococcus sedimenti]